MVVIIAKCVKCGKSFPKGIWTQSTCEQCSMKQPQKIYTYKRGIE